MNRPKLGEYLVSKGFITQKQLEEALGEQKKKGGFLGQILIEKELVSSSDIARAIEELSTKAGEEDKLGTFLVDTKIITPEQLKKAQEKQLTTHQKLPKTIQDLGFAKPNDIAKAVGKYWNIPYIPLDDYEPVPDIMQLIPEEIMRRHQIVPVRTEGNTLFIAMADPLDILAMDEVRLLTNHQLQIMVSSEKEISLVLDRFFSIKRAAKESLLGTEMEEVERQAEEGVEAFEGIAHKPEEGPVIKLVDTLIDGAINGKASDIHLEPQEPEMRVRYRIDGMLHDIMNVPRKMEAALVSRVKVLADMDIAEKRHPQDGHVIINKEGKQYDLRVSSFATVGGEKIVIRILDRSSMLLSMDDLGLSKNEEKTLMSLVSKPYGIILVTGPTGSGKTTTLYAMLSQLNSAAKNIITVEDPVEYRLDGVNQAQVNTQAGITFATGLRAILRQDPDIMMVGEIRDAETAEIAIHSSLTGHLVLSTLHTNDSAGAITRLIDMSVEPFLIASSVTGILAQRLVRTICHDCKEEYTPDQTLLKELGFVKKEGAIKFFRGKGCQYCLGTGYRGRIGIFELIRISDNIRDLIIKRVPTAAIKDAAVKEGMSTLRQSAVDKVLKGITTPAEIKRVVFSEEA